MDRSECRLIGVRVDREERVPRLIDKNEYRLIDRSTESTGVVFKAARAPLASWGYNPYLDGKAEQPWFVIIVGNPSTD